MKSTVVGFLLLIFSFYASAQNGNFRTRVTGNWDDPTTWERDADANGSFEESPSTIVPNLTSGTVTIRTNHVVTVSGETTVDQLVVESLGRINITSGVLTIADGAGVDLLNAGIVSTTITTQLIFSENSTYQHARNGGNIPLAVWNSNSVCQVTGVVNTVPGNLNVPGGFYHFIWDSPGQSGSIDFNGNLQNINGNLIITNTNGKYLALATSSAPSTITVNGDVEVQGTSRFAMTTNVPLTVNIGGDYTFNSTNASGSFLKYNSTLALTIGGDFNVNAPGGLLDISKGTGTSTINIAGNFSLVAGTLVETSSGSVTFNFNGSGERSFTNTGVIGNSLDFNYVVGNSCVLRITGESAVKGSTLEVSGAIRVESTNSMGAIVTGTSSGNVQTTTRTYNNGSSIIYSGSSPQFIGNGHPVSAGVTTEISNLNGVTFNTTTLGNASSANLLLGGNLILTSGNLNITSSSTSARSLTIEGQISSLGGQVIFSGPQSDLIINGSGSFGTFPSSSPVIRNITINRLGGSVIFPGTLSVQGTTTITNGTLQLGGTTTLTGTLTMSDGTLLQFNGLSLTLGGNYVTSGGFLSSNSSSSLSLTGNTVLTSPLSFSPSGNVLGNLVLNKGNSGVSATVNSPITVVTGLTLTDGELNILSENLTLNSNSTLSISSLADISGTSPGGGPWNLIYTGGSQVSGLEIPTSGQLQSLTISTNNGTQVSVGKDITVNDYFSNPNIGRNFICGRSMTVNVFNNGGTFTTSNWGNGLIVTSQFTNNGIFDFGNGKVSFSGGLENNGTFTCIYNIASTTFAGTTSITGSVTPVFNHVIITGTLNSPSIFELRGHFTNNGIFSSNNGTVIFSGINTQQISGSTMTSFNNITLSDNSIVSVVSNQALGGVLTLGEGAIFDADGSGSAVFTLLSVGDAAGSDASIAALPSGASVTGNVSVQRYWGVGDNIFRNISSPVSNGTLQQLLDAGVFVNGYPGSDFPCDGFCGNDNANLSWYDETLTGTFQNGWTDFPGPAGSASDTFVPGVGYGLYMWDGTAPTLWTSRGTVNQGDIEFTISNTVSIPAEPDADGWNLIGNPYPSSIVWEDNTDLPGGWTMSGSVDPTVWIYDEVAEIWRSYNAATNTGNNFDGTIATGQAFWVEVNGGGPHTLEIHEAAKTNNSGAYYRKRNGTIPTVTLALSYEGVTDNAFIQEGNHSRKMSTGIERMSLAFVGDGAERIAYYGLNNSENDIPVSVQVREAGEYTFKLSSTFNGDFYLVDKWLNTVTPVSKEYTFTIEASATTLNDRFIVTRNAGVNSFATEEVVTSVYPNPVVRELTVELRAENVAGIHLLNSVGQVVETGDVLYEAGVSKGQFDMSTMPAGVYFVRVVKSDRSVYIKKVIKREGLQ